MAEPDRDTQPDPPLAHLALRRRKRRDAALALPLVGVFLLASPFLDAFAGPGRVFGLPLGAAYVFGVWFGLVALAGLLARRLADDAEAG